VFICLLFFTGRLFFGWFRNLATIKYRVSDVIGLGNLITEVSNLKRGSLWVQFIIRLH